MRYKEVRNTQEELFIADLFNKLGGLREQKFPFAVMSQIP